MRSHEITTLEYDEKGNLVFIGGTYNSYTIHTVDKDGLTAQDILDSCDDNI